MIQCQILLYEVAWYDVISCYMKWHDLTSTTLALHYFTLVSKHCDYKYWSRLLITYWNVFTVQGQWSLFKSSTPLMPAQEKNSWRVTAWRSRVTWTRASLATVKRMLWASGPASTLKSNRQKTPLAGFTECTDCEDRTANAGAAQGPLSASRVGFQGRFSGGLTSSCGNQ